MKKTTLPLVIGNWKMNPQTNEAAVRLASDIKKRIIRVDDVEIVLAPPAVFTGSVAKVRNGKKSFKLGAQNAHAEKLGAFTGEVSLPMLQSFGVTHVIVGHSERRAHGESDEEINQKVLAVIKAGLTAVLCVGETKRDQAAHYLNRIEEQIKSACSGLSKTKLGSLVIAYEPVWAIGTGQHATPEDVHEMRIFMVKVLTDLYGRNYAGAVRVLYGGSVDEKNASPLIQEGLVDGFLVGGASLRAPTFAEIIKTVRTHGVR